MTAEEVKANINNARTQEININTERSRRFRQKRIDAGLCVYCGKPNDSKLQGCTECMAKRRAKQNRRYREMTPEQRKKYIRENTERNRKRYAELRKAELCIRCKKPVSGGGIHCDECKEKVREYQRWTYDKYFRSENEKKKLR